jgi:hypothetical protein
MIVNLKKIENHINSQHEMSTTDFFEMCINDNMDLIDIAELAGCSIYNLKRIARRYKFSFEYVKPIPRFLENKDFKEKSLNNNNFLSRQWINI